MIKYNCCTFCELSHEEKKSAIMDLYIKLHNVRVCGKTKLKPDRFFMGKPSQNYGPYWVSPKYGVTQFYFQPDISEHTLP